MKGIFQDSSPSLEFPSEHLLKIGQNSWFLGDKEMQNCIVGLMCYSSNGYSSTIYNSSTAYRRILNTF